MSLAEHPRLGRVSYWKDQKPTGIPTSAQAIMMGAGTHEHADTSASSSCDQDPATCVTCACGVPVRQEKCNSSC